MELVDVKAYLHFFMSRVYLCCSNLINILFLSSPAAASDVIELC